MSWWSRRRTGPISQAGTSGITVANTGVIGSIVTGPATYLLEDFPLVPANHPDPAALAPSRLLAAGHQLVPFTGRGGELERLAGRAVHRGVGGRGLVWCGMPATGRPLPRPRPPTGSGRLRQRVVRW